MPFPPPNLRAAISGGPFVLLVSAVVFGVVDVLVKLLGPSFTAWDIGVFRFGLGLLALLTLLRPPGPHPFRGHGRKLLIVRGVAGSFSFVTIVTAIGIAPFSSVFVLFYAFPAFSALLSPLLFKERIAGAEIPWILLALVGVAIFFDVHMEGTSLLGQALSLAGAVAAGIATSSVRKLREQNGSVVIYVYFCATGALVSIPGFLTAPHLPGTALQWSLLLAIAGLSLVAQLLMHHGLKDCKSWEGGLFLMGEAVVCALAGILLFGDAVTWRFFAGGAMILGSAAALNITNACLRISGAP